MSWSASVTVVPGQELDESDLTLVNVNEVEEHLEQFREAIASVFGVLLSGVLGGKEKSYRVVLAGHGNANHEPEAGFANDFLQITITQV